MSEKDHTYLRFNEFESNVKIFWKEFQTEKDFSDVTLVCENGRIQTHKLIISSYSPVFRNILKYNNTLYPIIFLKSVKHHTLQALVNFMYQGEVVVTNEDLFSFLELAKDLQIKGISETDTENDNYSNQCKEIEPVENIDETNNYSLQLQSFQNKIGEVEDDKKDTQLLIPLNKGNQYSCLKCEKYFSGYSGLYQHNSSVHKGIRYTCSQCNHKTKTKSCLNRHVKSIHEGVCYPCVQCNFKAQRRTDLKKHEESVHKGVRHSCNQCEFTGSTKSNVIRHVRLVHEGVQHSCNQCDFKAKAPYLIKEHIASIHEGICHPCNQCDYAGNSKYALTHHVKLIHE